MEEESKIPDFKISDLVKGILPNVVSGITPNQSYSLQAELNFKEAVGDYVDTKAVTDIKDYVNVLIKSERIHGVIISGEAGLGKSWVIKSIVKKQTAKWAYRNNFSTPLALYKFLYTYREGYTIILDDIEGILQEKKGVSLLKSALNTEKVRIVSYDSTTEKLDVPSPFNFNSKIIILTNEAKDSIDKALLSRVMKKEITFTFKEKMNTAEKILGFHYRSNLPQKDREEILSFIKENSSGITEGFSFRTIMQIAEYYTHNKENGWRTMAFAELSPNEDLKEVLDIINMYPDNVKAQIAFYEEHTGKSRRTFHRHKTELKKRGVISAKISAKPLNKVRGLKPQKQATGGVEAENNTSAIHPEMPLQPSYNPNCEIASEGINSPPNHVEQVISTALPQDLKDKR